MTTAIAILMPEVWNLNGARLNFVFVIARLAKKGELTKKLEKKMKKKLKKKRKRNRGKITGKKRGNKNKYKC